MDKNTKILIGIGAVVLVAGVGIYVYANRPKESKEDTLADTDTPESTGTSWTPSKPESNDDFPLKKGSKGDRVKAIQKRINMKLLKCRAKEDGIWGKNTEAGYKEMVIKDGAKEGYKFNVVKDGGFYVNEYTYAEYFEPYESVWYKSLCSFIPES